MKRVASPHRKPTAPANLTAVRASATNVALSWTDTCGFDTGVQIQRRTAGGSWFTIVDVVVANVTTYTDTTATTGLGYDYRVRALTLTTVSPYSNIATVQSLSPVPSPLPPPTNLVAVAGDGQVSTTWASVNGGSSYKVKRSLTATGTYSLIGTPSTTSFLDTNVVNGTRYFYVVATVGTGESVDSAPVSAVPTATAPPLPVPVPQTAPSAPTLTVTAGDATANANWTAPTGALSYTCKRGTVSGIYTTLSSNLTTPTYHDTGLVNGTPYFYVVLASNTVGDSAASNEISVTPAAAVGQAPAAPTSLTATPLSGLIHVAWTDAASTETAYQVERKKSTDAAFALLTTLAANATSYTDQAVTAGLTYQYRVRAMNGTTPSAYSNTGSATVPAPPPPLPSGTVWALNAGQDLQAALDGCTLGDTIVLQAGATFTLSPGQSFVLRDKGAGTGTDADFITIRTSNLAGIPVAGVRVNPTLHAGAMPKIVSATIEPAIITAYAAHHYRFIGVEIATTYASLSATHYNTILMGYDATGATAATTLAQLPSDLVFDRCYIHGTPTGNARRGLLMNTKTLSLINSYVSDYHEVGSDSQAIAGWNGPGPFLIENNYLEGAGENVMFGGADPSIPNLIPSDITFTGNTVAKKLSWKVGHATYAGIHWSVKNLLELKNAQRVVMDGNLFEYNWADEQTGFAIVFTVRNQNGTAPWCAVQNVTFRNNILRHTGSGINVGGYDSNFPLTSTRSTGFTISNNLLYDIDGVQWNAEGFPFELNGSPQNVTIQHNTLDFTGNDLLQADPGGSAVTTVGGFVFKNNLSLIGVYGFATQGVPFDTIFPSNVFLNNALAVASGYPATTVYLTVNEFNASFVSKATGNYALIPASPLNNAATDGTDIGVNMALLPVVT